MNAPNHKPFSRLIAGVESFRSKQFAENRELFQQLAVLGELLAAETLDAGDQAREGLVVGSIHRSLVRWTGRRAGRPGFRRRRQLPRSIRAAPVGRRCDRMWA
ncbi:MAG: hypothetical protein EOP70_17735 [Variovorax sp.]|nr:MAG: hypothetical protein EOP70_17735 [Variovorax sp.]